MHKSAMLRMQWFVEHYIPQNREVSVLDVGSYDVNGSYRDLFWNFNVNYVGLDMQNGPNVDYVPTDPYNWDGIKDESFDFIISGNAFEHIEFPWLTMEQIYKKLNFGGYACILAPFTIGEHRYPTDCYRYYADGFRALAKWSNFHIVDVTVGGIPNRDISDEWLEENLDDTMMIVAKTTSDNEFKNAPKFLGEYRVGFDSRWKKRYDFLFKWIKSKKKVEIISEFLKRNNIEGIYMFGWGHIGETVYGDLKDSINILGIIDSRGEDIKAISAIKTGLPIVVNEKICIVICVLDIGIKEILDEEYPKTKKYYIDEIFNEEHKKI